MVEGVGIRVELGKERIEFQLSGSHCLPRSRQFFQVRSGAVQPVRHPHLAVHRRRSGKMLLRLVALASAPVELAEAEVAVGDETGDLHDTHRAKPRTLRCLWRHCQKHRRSAYASRYQYARRQKARSHAVWSAPLIAIARAFVVARRAMGSTAPPCTSSSFIWMNSAARFTGSISVLAAEKRSSYARLRHRGA